jgi:lysophospholipase L1-like esterase
MAIPTYVIPGSNPLLVQNPTWLSGVLQWPNSLVSGDLSSPLWQAETQGVQPATVTPLSAADLAGGLTGANVNIGLNATHHLVHGITSPGTSITIAVDASGIAGSGQFDWVLYDTNAALLTDVPVTGVTGTLTTYSHTFSGLTIGNAYLVGMRFNNGAQGSFVMSLPRVSPSGVPANSLFAQPFVRLDPRPELLWGNGLTGTFQHNNLRALYPHSSHAEWRLATNAASVVTEWYNPFTVASNYCGVRVNGAAFADNLIPSSFVSLVQQALPSTIQQLDVVLSDNNSMATPYTAMPYLMAVYLPLGSSVGLVPRVNSPRRLVQYGDSTTEGTGATRSWRSSWTALLKQRYLGETFVDAAGSRRLFDEANGGAAQTALANRLALTSPTDLILLIGLVDYAQSAWTQAAFGAAYQALLAALVLRLPNTRIWCVTPIPQAAEGANANGDTLPNFRTRIGTAVTNIANSNVVLVDGTQWTTSADDGDGVHLNPEGHGKFFRGICIAFGLS